MKKKFLLFFIPCVFWWFFILYIIFGDFELHYTECMKFLFKMFLSSSQSGNIGVESSGMGSPWMAILFFCAIFLPVILCVSIFYIAVTSLVLFFDIPIQTFYSGFYLDNWLLWIAIIVLVLTVVGAFHFKLGEFQEDSSYVSGHHYEAEYHAFENKVKVKKVEDREGGGEWITNILLFLVRMIIIAVGGIFLFFFYKMGSDKSSTQNSGSDQYFD